MTLPMRARLGGVLMAVAAFVLAAAPGGLPRAVRAAEYTLETEATYAVAPDAGEIAVSIEVTFTNTTPDPEGQFSVFDEVKLAVHDEATAVVASDDDGDLDVEVGLEDDVNVATVELREELRFEETASFEVTYTLPDSDDPHLRVRPSVIVFPAWSFGTAGEVRVSIPAGYEIRVDGDPLTDDGGTLSSGAIEDPSQWLALVTAVQPAEYTTFDAAVPLKGGTADLRVRAFADDTAWGERTLALLVDALPLIEEEIGLPYPELGPLTVTEAVAADGSGFGEQAAGQAEILVGFDQPTFTVIHQIAHVWLAPSLVESRWLREGLASDVAARVADDLEVEPPFDPAAQAEERSDAAFPLDTWTANAGPQGEAYGYAASWAFLGELEEAVGADALKTVLLRAASSIGPYQSAQTEIAIDPATLAAPEMPLTTRSFLDHLETVSRSDLGPLFAERVLSEEAAALLPQRAEARSAFFDLVDAAGSWGAPDPVRGAMTAWEFDVARRQMDEAAAWLVERDALLVEMQEVGLSAPDRLQQAYRSYGGGPEADDELERQRAVVDAYTETAAQVNAERTFLERIGLIGGPDPASQLNLANARFAEGDLTGSVEAIGEAQRIAGAAEIGGIVRIVSAVLVAILLLGLAVLLVRRRASYTAAP